MPREVWLCNYCDHEEDTYGQADSHEWNCKYNPKVKTCQTCEHKLDTGYGSDCTFKCDKQGCEHYDETDFEMRKFDIRDCNNWEIEKWRLRE